jgi:hypothetical protein
MKLHSEWVSAADAGMFLRYPLHVQVLPHYWRVIVLGIALTGPREAWRDSSPSWWEFHLRTDRGWFKLQRGVA